jgi:hypothetical protein
MSRALLTAVTAVALALVATACGRVEGRTAWEEAIHTNTAPPPKPPADQVYPVKPPPFSQGIFPCSRCHEGGEPVADTGPAIPHALHVGRGIECGDCHFPDDEEAGPKIPSREACDTCHGDPAKLSENAKAYFAKVTAADGTTTFPHRWKVEDLKFDHVRHLKADVKCASCHGEPADTPFVKPKPVALMQRCVACHEQAKKPVACETCHEKQSGKAHANIVLRHAEDQRGCLDCHDQEDRDRLQLANGTTIPFSESFRLCGQCHGTQFRDWKVGLHGKRTGAWNGRREYRLCVHCHYPHEPRFQPMAPVAKPARPEEIR